MRRRTRPSTSTSPPITDESRTPRRVHQAGLRPVGRDRGRQRRRRRHGRLPARHRRASRCSCWRRAGCSTTRRSTGRWSGRTRRRGAAACPATIARSQVAEYNFSTGPTATTPSSPSTRRSPRTRATPSRGTGSSTRRSTRPRARPTRGCARACSAARRTSGAACAMRYGPLQFEAASRDGYDVDWPIGYDDISPYYDKVDVLLGCSGTKEGLVQVPDGIYQRPMKMNCVEVALQAARSRTMGRQLHPRPRRRDHGRRRSTTSTARAAWAAGAAAAAATSTPPSIRRPRSSIPRATPATSPSGRTPSSPRSSSTRPRARAAGVRVIDANTSEVMDFKARVVVLGAGTPRQHAHPAQLEVGRGIRRGWATRPASSAATSASTHMGPRGSGFIPHAHRAPRPPSTTGGRPRPTSRASATSRTSIPTSSAAITSRAAAAPTSTRGWPTTLPGFGKAFKSTVRKYYPAHDQHRRLRRGAAAQGEPRLPRRRGEGRLGHPGPALRLPVRRQRDQDGEGHGRHRGRDAARGGRGEHQDRPRRCCPRAGRSTRSGPRAWATTPRRRSPNTFCRLHDVPNVYFADAAPFVSGGTQNTTWSILAFCWRTMDYLKEQMRTGAV